MLLPSLMIDAVTPRFAELIAEAMPCSEESDELIVTEPPEMAEFGEKVGLLVAVPAVRPASVGSLPPTVIALDDDS